MTNIIRLRLIIAIIALCFVGMVACAYIGATSETAGIPDLMMNLMWIFCAVIVGLAFPLAIAKDAANIERDVRARQAEFDAFHAKFCLSTKSLDLRNESTTPF